jgi:uncharacterized protein Yka (UPF0111/DUF47 family)
MGLNILDLLLPRETKFFDYMEQQVVCLIKAIDIFKTLVHNISAMSEKDITVSLEEIKDLERSGDKLEQQIFAALNKTFITPIDREDIHLLSINIDRALDILTSISRKVDIYNIREVPDNVCNFTLLIEKIAEHMNSLIKQLRIKNYSEEVMVKMHDIENEADELFRKSMAELFSEKNSSVHIMKFKEFYEHLESAVDAIDYVGKLIRGIKVKIG